MFKNMFIKVDETLVIDDNLSLWCILFTSHVGWPDKGIFHHLCRQIQALSNIVKLFCFIQSTWNFPPKKLSEILWQKCVPICKIKFLVTFVLCTKIKTSFARSATLSDTSWIRLSFSACCETTKSWGPKLVAGFFRKKYPFVAPSCKLELARFSA